MCTNLELLQHLIANNAQNFVAHSIPYVKLKTCTRELSASINHVCITLLLRLLLLLLLALFFFGVCRWCIHVCMFIHWYRYEIKQTLDHALLLLSLSFNASMILIMTTILFVNDERLNAETWINKCTTHKKRRWLTGACSDNEWAEKKSEWNKQGKLWFSTQCNECVVNWMLRMSFSVKMRR